MRPGLAMTVKAPQNEIPQKHLALGKFRAARPAVRVDRREPHRLSVAAGEVAPVEPSKQRVGKPVHGSAQPPRTLRNSFAQSPAARSAVPVSESFSVLRRVVSEVCMKAASAGPSSPSEA